ncbi:MAG TPA: glycosyltransferase family 39 protein [Acidobacteriaceae bacterium]|nr:glycosyltransferase family 39 protein [Acidobacteriaceae bacterium]
MPSFRLHTSLTVLSALAAGTALRFWFVHAFPQIQGDTLLYADIARNWLNHGIYGRSIPQPGGAVTIAPTLVRLPGYPAFLALCFAIFGQQNYSAVLYLQVLMDLGTCLLLAAFVRKLCGHWAAMAALWLAALCPFTANYVAMPLTETPSIFCVALGLYAFAEVLDSPRWNAILTLALAWSYAALLRPDGALLAVAFFPALILYGRKSLGFQRSLRTAVTCGLISILPFVVWTLRNWRTFHVFQPLAPRSATDPGEPSAAGFQRWTKTWIADFASTYEIYWNVPGDEIDVQALPARALDDHGSETLDLIARYNNGGDRLTPKIDAGFAALAAQRIHADPFRYYVTLPILRLADMWLRPRVEMLNIELRWWQYRLHHAETEISYAYGALNLLYLLAGLVGMFYWPRYATAMVAYIVLRSLLLATIEAPEPRYTLECFPIVIAFAAAAIGRMRCRTNRRRVLC